MLLGGDFMPKTKKPVVYSTGEKREFLVVKRNDFIQKSRHQLTVQEQKIVLYMISRIKPDDKDFMEQEFSTPEFCRICDIDAGNGGNYTYLKATVQKLRDRSVWVRTDDNKEILFGWISRAVVDHNTGKITLRFDESLKPYLLDLKKNFTTYNLSYTLSMKSQYGIRLFELLKSYLYKDSKKKRVSFTLDELKHMLFAQSYKQGGHFKTRVLEPAIKEINELTDYHVTYELTKTDRAYTDVHFVFSEKTLEERMAKLDYKKMQETVQERNHQKGISRASVNKAMKADARIVRSDQPTLDLL